MTEKPTAVLALEASTEACSVALGVGDQVWSRFNVQPRSHARDMLGMVEAVLLESGLQRDQIALLTFGRGPGAFTGVRISVGVAQGLAWGLGIPVAGISTLAVIAQGDRRRHGHSRVLVAVDARMNEVYWAACAEDAASGLMLPLSEEAVSLPEDIVLPADWKDCRGAGSGWGAYSQAINQPAAGRLLEADSAALPDAMDLLPYARDAWSRGTVLPAAQASPVYLRNKVVS